MCDPADMSSVFVYDVNRVWKPNLILISKYFDVYNIMCIIFIMVVALYFNKYLPMIFFIVLKTLDVNTEVLK